MVITDISSGNKALEFIENRIKDEKYRGSRSSQHNRYTREKIVDILTLLDKYSPNQKLMTIRTTDISKRPKNTPEEFTYAKFCEDAKHKTGIGTQDAMRKNIFVDIHRMGLIERYDKNKNPTAPFSRSGIKYVSISNQGLRLIKAKKMSDQSYIFSKGINALLGDYINILLYILRWNEYKIKNISIYEYMFFVSAINTDNTKTEFDIDINKAVDLINAYKKLAKTQKESVIGELKKELNPKNYSGTKTNKRDFHNWCNKAAQVFYLLNQTVYFEQREEKLVLKERQKGHNKTKRLNRSLSEKGEYFKNHEVEKREGFELHHVVPLAWSESEHHFNILDKWENMVYIDGFSHAKITQNRNRNVVMETNQDDIKLSDYSNNEVYLKLKDNISYEPRNQAKMVKYNKKLREEYPI